MTTVRGFMAGLPGGVCREAWRNKIRAVLVVGECKLAKKLY